ncbi:hypothetical protein ACWATR_21180 [Nostoc sp. UIC 10890]
MIPLKSSEKSSNLYIKLLFLEVVANNLVILIRILSFINLFSWDLLRSL